MSLNPEAATFQHTSLERHLHDLCQPLTSLMCQLEYGQLMGDVDSLRSALDLALVDCRRVFESIASMRVRLEEESREDSRREGECA